MTLADYPPTSATPADDTAAKLIRLMAGAGADRCRRDGRRDRRHLAMGGPRCFAAALDLTQADEALKARFWAKVDQRGPDECWPWSKHCKDNGYGQFVIASGWHVTASRAAFALVNGPLADGEVVCHRCDNPPCCNPACLFKGTQIDNGNDCIVKGRGNRSRGERTGAARLTAAAVIDIRQTPTSFGVKSQLARKYSVSLTAIRNVLSGETWGHVS